MALDGVVFDGATAEALIGKVGWEDGWYAFSLRFDGWCFEKGERLGDWNAYPDPSA